MQLLLQFASLHQTGNNLQEDPTTRGSRVIEFGSETDEHRSFLRVEEDSLPRTQTFDCGHSYAQEKYAMKRREKTYLLKVKLNELDNF